MGTFKLPLPLNHRGSIYRSIKTSMLIADTEARYHEFESQTRVVGPFAATYQRVNRCIWIGNLNAVRNLAMFCCHGVRDLSGAGRGWLAPGCYLDPCFNLKLSDSMIFIFCSGNRKPEYHYFACYLGIQS